MHKAIRLLLYSILVLCFGSLIAVKAATPDYGAQSAALIPDSELTVAKMLTLAVEDEYLAKGEYLKIMEEFGAQHPFSNIIKAEERHIAWLKPLFVKYGVMLPPDRGVEMAKIPKTLAQAYQLGVQAEIENIKMYQRFLKQTLPDDVKAVFQHLLKGSENHLSAFKRAQLRRR
ncbi:MAG: hypothetical protein CENE_00212 [Candidatus Celerinatantimonas neptuna]|nr:MAG: hypothetical protein CENE_00212 [Candidatus Celerinatantimonas neptuna]